MQIKANGITLEVEEHGSPQGEPLVLIMGLGMQLIAWHEDFVQLLVSRGFRVIRFDNRDIGLSHNFDHLGLPNLALEAMKHAMGWAVRSPYSLADMADDTIGLLDAMGIAKAHVCGASMGGMVAQQLAARHPGRLQSVTLMMTSSGARRLPGPSLRVRRAMISRPSDPKSFDSIVSHYVDIYKLIGSPGFPSTDEWLRRRLSMSVRRSYRPGGTARQLTAIVADGDRTPMLSRIKLPVQIIHGLADPLVPVAAGQELARSIAGSHLDLVDGMGHDLPMALWPRFADGISAAAGRA
jgi:pimeloyl-ACP methyl ester carboxylesterase